MTPTIHITEIETHVADLKRLVAESTNLVTHLTTFDRWQINQTIYLLENLSAELSELRWEKEQASRKASLAKA